MLENLFRYPLYPQQRHKPDEERVSVLRFFRVAEASGKLQPVEIKLTATPSAGHVEPLNRFLSIAGEDAAGPGLLVCRTDQARALPNGHMALPWQAFPDWLQSKLVR